MFLTLLSFALVAGCNEPFQPFSDGERVFSMFGYLDLNADTQWVRVRPLHQGFFLSPEPIDAMVTLEEVESGRIVTLTDSLLRIDDGRLGGVRYAHNFWTTEPLERGARYRLKAVRSDGAATTALVTMPEDEQITMENESRIGSVFARSGDLLFVDARYLMQNTCNGGGYLIETRRERTKTRNGGINFLNEPPFMQCRTYAGRTELQVVIGDPADRLFAPELSDLEIALPDRVPSNVENGVGFVAGLAVWSIPSHRCEVLAPSPDHERPCDIVYNRESASVEGMLVKEDCRGPADLTGIRLVEEFPTGSRVAIRWITGRSGEFRFFGIEPGAGLLLDVGRGEPPLRLPVLAPGERYVLGEVAVPIPC